jgi:hypothetical protein
LPEIRAERRLLFVSSGETTMRSPMTTLAFLFALTLSHTASAQTVPAAAVAPRDPSVTIEIQGRIGGGEMWARSSDGAGIPAIEGGNAGDMNVGAALSLRHYGSGFGVTLGYTHAFTGIETHYGTHAFDARLSERVTFFRHGHTSLSVLLEGGVAFMDGGAHYECPHSWLWGTDSSCTSRDVSTSGIGGVGAIALQVRYRALLVGIEGDYRHIVGSGALVSQDDFMLMFRGGVAFDL